MKLALAALTLLALTLAVAEPAAATCYVEKHTIDPVRRDTGTPVDMVVITYYTTHCEPIPP